jgi:hypothetical protein
MSRRPMAVSSERKTINSLLFFAGFPILLSGLFADKFYHQALENETVESAQYATTAGVFRTSPSMEEEAQVLVP